MLTSVSGWSGPSLAFVQLQRLLVQPGASACRPQVGVADGEVVHARQRVGVVGAELGLPQLERLLVQRQRSACRPGSA